jgi:hypothetical protein
MRASAPAKWVCGEKPAFASRIQQRMEFAHRSGRMRWQAGRAGQVRDRRLLRVGQPDGAHRAACSTQRLLMAAQVLSLSAVTGNVFSPRSPLLLKEDVASTSGRWFSKVTCSARRCSCYGQVNDSVAAIGCIGNINTVRPCGRHGNC